jgi:UPF0755 protein
MAGEIDEERRGAAETAGEMMGENAGEDAGEDAGEASGEDAGEDTREDTGEVTGEKRRDLKRNLAAFLTGQSESPDPTTGWTDTGGAGADPVDGTVRAPAQGTVVRTRLPRPRLTAGAAATHQPVWTDTDEQTGMLVLEEDPLGEPVVDPRYDLDDRNWVRYRSSWGGFLRLALFVVLIVVAFMWVRGRIYSWIDAQIEPSGASGAMVEFTIPDGASVNDVASALDSEGIISNATVFRYWLRCEGDITITGFLGCDTERSFQAGDYELNLNMAFEDVVSVLDAGPIPEVFFKITVPEGLRWTEMAERLIEENPEFDRVELEAAFVSPAVASDYMDTTVDRPTMEGLLFPATYDVSEDLIGDEARFLQRMSNEFDSRFTALLSDPGAHPDITALELDPYDVIVIASLIEEEARVPEDRPKISRVIYNRLLNDMRLDIDATTCYAVNKSCADLTVEDLEFDSPWNTRVVTGIPPTPISAPGEASLEAALAPADGDWLFYVLTDEGGVEGAHHFSTTIEEHNQYVEICRELGYC